LKIAYPFALLNELYNRQDDFGMRHDVARQYVAPVVRHIAVKANHGAQRNVTPELQYVAPMVRHIAVKANHGAQRNVMPEPQLVVLSDVVITINA